MKLSSTAAKPGLSYLRFAVLIQAECSAKHCVIPVKLSGQPGNVLLQ